MHKKNLSLSYESDDNIAVAAEPMSDDEDQWEESDAEECQDDKDYDNTTTKNSKTSVSKKEIEDLVELNKLPPTVKYRFCDKNVEDNQELSN